MRPPGAAPRLLPRLLCLLALALALGVTAPPLAAGSLPDGRLYELVSPAAKAGTQAGAGIAVSLDATRHTQAAVHYSVASADGNAVLFWSNGPLGSTPDGYPLGYFIARRSAGAWKTSAATPRALEPYILVRAATEWIDPSADFSKIAYAFPEHQLLPAPDKPCSSNIFIAGPDPFAPPTWIAQPQVPNPLVNCSEAASNNPGMAVVGGAPDLSTVYFGYAGTLLPGDAARTPHVFSEIAVSPSHGSREQTAGPWGFYEYDHGTLREAGVLPDGSVDPFGAVPPVIAASSQSSPAIEAASALNANAVSEDGSRAFFVSPDPRYSLSPGSRVTLGGFCQEHECTTAPPQLYVRITAPDGAQSTKLVSEDPLLPALGDTPAPAPDGVFGHSAALPGSETAFIYASPDGSRAFFESVDQLTGQAPDDSQVKTYEFDLETDSLTYLPGVRGPILASTPDGSRFAFEDLLTSQLAIFSAGPEGGTVTPVAPLSGPHECGLTNEANECILAARLTRDGSTFVFSMRAPLAGFNNGGGLYEQIYRYDVPSGALSCVSCPPPGVTPSGGARISLADQGELGDTLGAGETKNGIIDERGISEDGARVFFDTPDPLVPQDVNGVRDVYESERGRAYLISSGQSPHESLFLDNSEDGGDVFFATAEGISPADTDGGYDVYDARIPRPGDNPAPAPAPCQAALCQAAPPPAPPPLPSSATFSGSENPRPHRKPAKKKPKKRGPGRPGRKHASSGHGARR